MSLDANVSDTMFDEIARQLGIDAADLKKSGFTFFPLIMPVHLTNLQKDLAPYGGKIEQNYLTTALGNNDQVIVYLTVPATKRWYLWGGKLLNADNVARNCGVTLMDESSHVIFVLAKTQSVGAGASVYYPNTEAVVTQIGSGAYPIPMKAGWQLQFKWLAGGASTGGTAQYTALVVEVDA